MWGGFFAKQEPDVSHRRPPLWGARLVIIINNQQNCVYRHLGKSIAHFRDVSRHIFAHRVRALVSQLNIAHSHHPRGRVKRNNFF